MTLLATLSAVAKANPGRLKFIAGDPIGAGSLVGLIEPHFGWVLANGAVLPADARHSVLRGIVGTKFGALGTLPIILDGVVPIPKGATSFPTVGVAGGEVTHVLSLSEYPNHLHSSLDNIGPFQHATLNIDGWPDQTQSNGQVNKTSNSFGGGGAHPNMPSYVVGGYVLVKL